MNFKLYYDAINADHEYQAELESVYGSKASDMRYSYDAHNHPGIKEAHDAFLKAMDAWLTEMKLHRP